MLVLRCRRNDRTAWDELVDLWTRPLQYYLRRLIADEEEVWNLLQEVWLKALRGIHTLRDTNRLAP